jgi:hypothetical protein
MGYNTIVTYNPFGVEQCENVIYCIIKDEKRYTAEGLRDRSGNPFCEVRTKRLERIARTNVQQRFSAHSPKQKNDKIKTQFFTTNPNGVTL